MNRTKIRWSVLGEVTTASVLFLGSVVPIAIRYGDASSEPEWVSTLHSYVLVGLAALMLVPWRYFVWYEFDDERVRWRGLLGRRSFCWAELAGAKITDIQIRVRVRGRRMWTGLYMQPDLAASRDAFARHWPQGLSEVKVYTEEWLLAWARTVPRLFHLRAAVQVLAWFIFVVTMVHKALLHIDLRPSMVVTFAVVSVLNFGLLAVALREVYLGRDDEYDTPRPGEEGAGRVGIDPSS